MTNTLLDKTLYTKGIELLEENLGPVQTLRFLALVSRQPFDYQNWRQGHFGEMSLTEILAGAVALTQEKLDQPNRQSQ